MNICLTQSKKGLTTKLSNLTFAHETISKVAYYLVVGGQLSYSNRFMSIACDMGLSQFDFCFILEEGPKRMLTFLLACDIDLSQFNVFCLRRRKAYVNVFWYYRTGKAI